MQIQIANANKFLQKSHLSIAATNIDFWPCLTLLARPKSRKVSITDRRPTVVVHRHECAMLCQFERHGGAQRAPQEHQVEVKPSLDHHEKLVHACAC